MSNIIVAAFSGSNVYTSVSGLWQYDYGQTLRIQGLRLPTAVEIHFSYTEKGGDSVTRIGTTHDGVTDVPIPDSFLENNGASQDYKIYAFVYLSGTEHGNTEHRVTMQVQSRPKPEVPVTPEEPELFRETIQAVNDAAARAKESEDSARNSAEKAEAVASSAGKALKRWRKIPSSP